MNDDSVKHSKDTPEVWPPVKAGSATHEPSLATLVGVVPEHLLDEGEIVILAIKPSLWFIFFHSAKIILSVFVLMLIMPFLREKIGFSLSNRVICQVAGAIILLQLTISTLQWLSRLYVLTNRRVMRIRGVFTIDVFEAHLTKIQNTYLTLAIHERFLGLGSIQFATAGSGGIEATWMNINAPLEVHELIRRAIRQVNGRNGGNGI